MSDLKEAKEAVNDLRNGLSAAIEALEALEGYIYDADSIEGVTLDWGRGGQPPSFVGMFNMLELHSATFEEKI